MTRRFSSSHRRAGPPAVLLVVLLVLAVCGGQQPLPIDLDNVVAIMRVDGSATLARLADRGVVLHLLAESGMANMHGKAFEA